MLQLLRKFRRRTTSSKLARHTLAYGLTSAITAAMAVSIGPILTHYLEPEDYAIAALFIALFNTLAPFVGLGSNNVLRRRYFQQESHHLPTVVLNSLVVALISAGALTVGAVATYQLWGSPTLSVVWVCAFFPWAMGRYVLVTCTSLLQVQGRPAAFGILTSLQSFLMISLTLGLVVGVGLKWEGRVLGHVLSMAALGIASGFILKRQLGSGARLDRKVAKETIALGFPVVPYTVLDRANQLVDRALIAGLSDLGAAGYYTLGFNISGLTSRVSQAFNQAWQPWLFERLKENTKDSLKRVRQALFIACVGLVVAALALSLAVRWLFPLLIGDKYLPVIDLVPWLAMGFAVQGMALLHTSFLIYAERTHYLSTIAVSVGVANLAVTGGAVWLAGAKGASIAMLLSAIVRFAAVRTIARRLVPLS